jgi:O-antigen/teichoic acid export membrane protein
VSEQQSSYRQIMKATSLFGGVQFFQIIIQIVRSKFIAMLLGPAGMGISGLLTATAGLIAALTNFGLGTSAVKDIAEANSITNKFRISTVVIVMRRLVWITGALGAIICLLLSPWLSKLTFGNSDYIISFVWISITLLFNQLCNGQLVLLQGMRKLQYLAKANLYGSVVGLIFTVPIYYKFGIHGIVPGIIVTSVVSLLFSWLFARKVKFEPIRVSKTRTIAESKNMMTMGFMISLSSLISLGASYLIRIFISRVGSVADVGLYNAGFAIINTYVGLIFTAMATDYYPRLSSVSQSNLLCKETVNQQAEIALLILAPIIIIFLVFIEWVIIILYSNQFIAVSAMIYWAALGMFFKAASWAVGFLFLAKGESKLFFLSELIANVYILLFNIIGYYYWGLTGLGLSFLIGYLVCLIQVFLIAKSKFEFGFNKLFVNIFILQFLFAILSFLSVRFLKWPYHYIFGSVLIVASISYSYKQLDRRIGIRAIIQGLIKNK